MEKDEPELLLEDDEAINPDELDEELDEELLEDDELEELEDELLLEDDEPFN